MLTHELRTPATAICLAAETQRTEFDSLPVDSQKAFLQICEELQRLNRVIDASKNYLKFDGSNHLLDASTQSVVSVNCLMENILEPYFDKVTYQPLLHDKSLRLDRYWVELCIKNLIENSLIHGKPPVILSILDDKDILVISIQDDGTTSFTSLDQMAIPFQKDHASRGLGLGLTIVQKVVAAMKGELFFKTKPTRFSIKLRQII